MKKVKILYYRIFRPSIMEKCLKSAYGDLQSLIDDIFTNIGRHGLKLTYDDLVYSFNKYDWKDIIDALEVAENNCPSSDHQNPHIDLKMVIEDFKPNILESKWSNSYFQEWLTRDF